jgi:hypothetical protein
MSRIVVAMTLAACLAGTDTHACGDKFLVIGRGVRAQRAKGAVHRASILMYLDPRTDVPAAVKDAKLETNLKLAGHRIRSVETPAALDAALLTGDIDIVLVGVADMKALESRAGDAPSRPTLLPILYDPTEEDLAAAERQYRCVMRSPGKTQHFLAVIDEAMVLRSAAMKKDRRVP